MSGQISIRLPDDVIDRLNRTAKKMGIRRAELIRSSIETGLGALDDDSPKIEEQLRELKREILNSMSALPLRVRAVIQGEKIKIEDDEHQADRDQTQSENLIEVLDPDDPSDQHARSIEPPQTSRIPKNKMSKSESKVKPEKTDSETQTIVLEEVLISARLDQALQRMDGGIAEMAQELNMRRDVLEDVLAGRRNVPLSRAIRVEAKLQQWESGQAKT